jgi:hypothetical protein
MAYMLLYVKNTTFLLGIVCADAWTDRLGSCITWQFVQIDSKSRVVLCFANFTVICELIISLITH